MEAPKVLQFIVRFMGDEAFRMSVLRAEMTAMLDFGLTQDQAIRLRSLDSGTITSLLLKEATDHGADVVKTKKIMKREEDCDSILLPPQARSTTTSMPSAAEAMYEEGYIHLHCVNAEDPVDGLTKMWIRGHGLGASPEFEFRLENTSTKIVGAVISEVQVRNDLFQRVQVQAQLTAGKWKIVARNFVAQDFDTMTALPFLYVDAT